MATKALNFCSYTLGLIITVITLALPLSISAALAEVPGLPDASDPVARGLAIATESDRRDHGFKDSRANLKMILTNAYGDTSERELRFLTLENVDPNDGDRNLIIFDRPRDVKGTSLLTYAHILEADDQWMYLPALKRVKRISSTNKSGPFMGSEFAFEDFSAQELGKYTYKWLRDEACGDRTCHVIEQKPQYENSGYTRQIGWTDTTDYQVRKSEFYDRKNQLLKTLEFTEYTLHLEKYWRAHNLKMTNHQTGKGTTLTWDSFAFQTGLDDKDFSKNALKRAR